LFARNSFIIAQEINVEEKRIAAAMLVAGAGLSAFAAGWIPTPFIDAAVCVSIFTAMVIGLAAIYGISKLSVTHKLAIVVTSGGVGLGAMSALKLIPVIGTAVGGAVDSVAGLVLTVTAGIVYHSVD
jgi:uncharacterized protein (DUF697 family)